MNLTKRVFLDMIRLLDKVAEGFIIYFRLLFFLLVMLLLFQKSIYKAPFSFAIFKQGK